MKPHTISNDAQLNSNGRLSHLLGLEGLPKNQIEKILDVADNLICLLYTSDAADE